MLNNNPSLWLIWLGYMWKFYAQNAIKLWVWWLVWTDISEDNMNKFSQDFPDYNVSPSISGLLHCNPKQVIVASNTPAHTSNIRELIAWGVKSILSEKPLWLTTTEVLTINDLAKKENVSIYTAFLIAFSPAVQKVVSFMKESNLILTSWKVDWWKNRINNNRPTAWNLEDESVHWAHLLYLLAGINQEIESAQIAWNISYDQYVDPKVQAEAREYDSSFPSIPSSATNVMTLFKTTRTKITTLLSSSFVAFSQRRVLELTLSDKDTPDVPKYAVEIHFDKKTDNGSKDTIVIIDLQNNSDVILSDSYKCNKLKDQLQTFLDSNNGTPDIRLTDIDLAVTMTKWVDAALESHINNSVVMLDHFNL